MSRVLFGVDLDAIGSRSVLFNFAPRQVTFNIPAQLTEDELAAALKEAGVGESDDLHAKVMSGYQFALRDLLLPCA